MCKQIILFVPNLVGFGSVYHFGIRRQCKSICSIPWYVSFNSLKFASRTFLRKISLTAMCHHKNLQCFFLCCHNKIYYFGTKIRLQISLHIEYHIEWSSAVEPIEWTILFTIRSNLCMRTDLYPVQHTRMICWRCILYLHSSRHLKRLHFNSYTSKFTIVCID